MYQVRPQALELLRATEPFYELIAFSNMPESQLEQVIEHLELLIQMPILEKLASQKQKKGFYQWKKKIEIRTFFQFMVGDVGYLRPEGSEDHLENLSLLTKNRSPKNITLISGN